MMMCGNQRNIAKSGKAIVKLYFLGTVLLGLSLGIANAALIPINSSLGVGGSYAVSGTTLTLNDSVMALASTIPFNFDFFTPDGAYINNTIDLTTTFQSTSFVIDGWTVDMDTLLLPPGQLGSITELDGSGFISGNGYDRTAALWAFTAQAANTYSITVTAVPVPAAVWLFGCGLIGLIAVARRKNV